MRSGMVTRHAVEVDDVDRRRTRTSRTVRADADGRIATERRGSAQNSCGRRRSGRGAPDPGRRSPLGDEPRRARSASDRPGAEGRQLGLVDRRSSRRRARRARRRGGRRTVRRAAGRRGRALRGAIRHPAGMTDASPRATVEDRVAAVGANLARCGRPTYEPDGLEPRLARIEGLLGLRDPLLVAGRLRVGELALELLDRVVRAGRHALGAGLLLGVRACSSGRRRACARAVSTLRRRSSTTLTWSRGTLPISSQRRWIGDAACPWRPRGRSR